MKVQELIDALREMDPDAEVRLGGRTYNTFHLHRPLAPPRSDGRGFVRLDEGLA